MFKGARHRFSASPAAASVSMTLGALVALAWSAVTPKVYSEALLSPWHGVTVHGAICNGLLTIFFLGIGLELSRERRNGLLRQWANARAPICAALGGMLASAALTFIAGVVFANHDLLRSWGVPMATDVAFVIGALAFAGERIPRELRIFLLTLAVADDAGSLSVLAVTGPAPRHLLGVVAAAIIVMLMIALRRRLGVAGWCVILVGLWTGLSYASIDPPLAGLIVGVAVQPSSQSERLEMQCATWSARLVLPLFALASCGVRWQEIQRPAIALIATLTATRLAGKVFGIIGGVAVLRLLGLQVPNVLTTRRLFGVGALCAMGFTVPLVFAQHVFAVSSEAYGAVTVALLVATVLGAVIGIGVLRSAD